MNKRCYRSIVILVLAAMFAAFVTPAYAEDPAPEKQTAKYEIKFMENMIDHHAMAVMMAEMCTMKAIHTDLKTLCETALQHNPQKLK